MIGFEVSLGGCLIRPTFNQDVGLRYLGTVPFVPQTSFVLGQRVRSNLSRDRLNASSMPAFTRCVTTTSIIVPSAV